MCILELVKDFLNSAFVSTDLMSDPTKCRATEELEFKLDDIARHYNGITELTVFGQGLLNLDKWFLLKLIPKNDYGASYSICKQNMYSTISK